MEHLKFQFDLLLVIVFRRTECIKSEIQKLPVFWWNKDILSWTAVCYYNSFRRHHKSLTRRVAMLSQLLHVFGFKYSIEIKFLITSLLSSHCAHWSSTTLVKDFLCLSILMWPWILFVITVKVTFLSLPAPFLFCFTHKISQRWCKCYIILNILMFLGFF